MLGTKVCPNLTLYIYPSPTPPPPSPCRKQTNGFGDASPLRCHTCSLSACGAARPDDARITIRSTRASPIRHGVGVGVLMPRSAPRRNPSPPPLRRHGLGVPRASPHSVVVIPSATAVVVDRRAPAASDRRHGERRALQQRRGGHGRQRNRRRQAGRNADGSSAAAAVVQRHPSERQAEAESVPARQPTHHRAQLGAVLSRPVAHQFAEAERVLVLSAREHGADVTRDVRCALAAELAGSQKTGVHRDPRGCRDQ